MSTTLTVRLDPKLARMLKEAVRTTGAKRSDLIREALRRHLVLQAFERARQRTLPYARKAGFVTDEDVFREVS